MYVVPPMDEEPPPGFVTFVAVHVGTVRAEAERLTGAAQRADEVYPMVLSDVALHWRRLRLRRRLTGRDEAAAYLRKRLEARTAQWREDQLHPVEVQVLRPPTPVHLYAPVAASIALRKAAVLESTERARTRPLAEAAIAWEHAWQRARWHRIGRLVAGVSFGFLALMYALPQPTP
jgi:C4-dicarboxylate-specific signal transduction histidine kinase